MWNSFADKIIVTSQRWFWAKTTVIQAMCHKLEKSRAYFFQRLFKCNPFQSCPFVSIHTSLSFCCAYISFTLFKRFKYIILRDIAPLI